jgi:acyl dehydratase
VATDPSYIGRRYTLPEPYLVGREKIREFADAIGADDSAYRDPAAAAALGHPDVIAPPTFPVMISQRAAQAFFDDIQLDMSRVVHGDQRFVYTRPVRAGDRLSAGCEVEEIMTRAGNEFLTTRVDITTDTGDPVVSVWARLVIRA